jgi:cytoskeleton protein RodZ
MPSIGETLREARIRQRLDVADVEERTKIRAKYLRALENDEFDRLPGSTFVRSFLRTYAEVLGLDPYLLIEEYRLHHEPRDELEPHAFAAPEPRRGRDRRYGGPPRPGMLVVMGIVGLLAFLLILGLTGGDDEPEEAREQAATETERAQAERERRAERRRRRRRAAGAVAVQVTPVEPTYLCVDKGLGTPVAFEGIIAQAETFRGKRVRINLGKPSAQIRVNGRPFRVEPTPNPVGFEFAASGRKEIPPGQRPCAAPRPGAPPATPPPAPPP